MEPPKDWPFDTAQGRNARLLNARHTSAEPSLPRLYCLPAWCRDRTKAFPIVFTGCGFFGDCTGQSKRQGKTGDDLIAGVVAQPLRLLVSIARPFGISQMHLTAFIFGNGRIAIDVLAKSETRRTHQIVSPIP